MSDDNRTMQQVDHDAWEAGYGVGSSSHNDYMNELMLKQIREYMAKKKAEEEAAKAPRPAAAVEPPAGEQPEEEKKLYSISELPAEVRTREQVDHDAWEEAAIAAQWERDHPGRTWSPRYL